MATCLAMDMFLVRLSNIILLIACNNLNLHCSQYTSAQNCWLRELMEPCLVTTIKVIWLFIFIHSSVMQAKENLQKVVGSGLSQMTFAQTSTHHYVASDWYWYHSSWHYGIHSTKSQSKLNINICSPEICIILNMKQTEYILSLCFSVL